MGCAVTTPKLPTSFDPCEKAEEFCNCGRQMIRTLERSSVADRNTGIKPMEAWHSCPRYFMSIWRNLLTLGTGGMGHESHAEANPIVGREWR